MLKLLQAYNLIRRIYKNEFNDNIDTFNDI